MRVRLAVAALENRVFINEQANMTPRACRVNMGIPFTHCKLPAIYSASLPRCWSKAIAFRYVEKNYHTAVR